MRVELKALLVLVGLGAMSAVLVAQSAGGGKPSQRAEAKLHIVIPSQIKCNSSGGCTN